MADPIDSLILTALTQAAAEPHGVALFASKSATGLFPATSAGKTAARRAIEAGYMNVERSGKPVKETAFIRPAGLDKLIAEANPKPVLDDFVRVLESREAQAQSLIVAAREMTEQLAALKRVVSAIMPNVTANRLEPHSQPSLVETLRSRLLDWSASAGEDCPLPVLFRDLPTRTSVGEFHDALRQLHARGELYLHPWTGPLYELPEPTLALLVGHEIAYYASLKSSKFKVQSSNMEMQTTASVPRYQD